MPRRPNNGTDTIIVATAKVHRQQAITSSFDDDTRIPKSARVAFRLNASETEYCYRCNHRRHRQSASPTSHHFVVDNDTCIPKSARVAFKLNASEIVTGTPEFLAATDATNAAIATFQMAIAAQVKAVAGLELTAAKFGCAKLIYR
jgi:hypothetical protein